MQKKIKPLLVGILLCFCLVAAFFNALACAVLYSKVTEIELAEELETVSHFISAFEKMSCAYDNNLALAMSELDRSDGVFAAAYDDELMLLSVRDRDNARTVFDPMSVEELRRAFLRASTDEPISYVYDDRGREINIYLQHTWISNTLIVIGLDESAIKNDFPEWIVWCYALETLAMGIIVGYSLLMSRKLDWQFISRG